MAEIQRSFSKLVLALGGAVPEPVGLAPEMVVMVDARFALGQTFQSANTVGIGPQANGDVIATLTFERTGFVEIYASVHHLSGHLAGRRYRHTIRDESNVGIMNRDGTVLAAHGNAYQWPVITAHVRRDWLTTLILLNATALGEDLLAVLNVIYRYQE